MKPEAGSTAGANRFGMRTVRVLVYVAMFGLAYIVFAALLQRGGSDLSIHATWAAEGDFMNPRTFLRHGAHPLWHALVALVMLTGVSVKVAAALITAALKVIELFLMERLMQQYLKEEIGEACALCAAVCCALVMALCVPGINPTVYFGIGSANTWHSPTQMIAMVFMLLCVPYSAKCYADFERRLPIEGAKTILPWRNAIALGVMLLISLVAKPTFMQAFLPAAGLFFLVQWIRHPQNSRFFGQVILVVLPSVLFMVLQYMYYFGIIVPSQGSMALQISLEKVMQVALATLLIQAFPIWTLLSCARRKDFRSPLLTLTLLFNGVGILEFLILGETGRRAADGNFGWGMMGGALMFWVMMLIMFLRSFAASRREKKWKASHGIGFALLCWHLGSGIYYLVYLLTHAVNQ